MRVCFLAGTLGCGGAERQLLYMLRALRRHSVQTRVLSLTRGETFENEIEEMGIEVEWVGKTSNRSVRLLNIITNLRKQPIDVLQSVHFYTNMYAGCAGRLLRLTNIGAIRSDLSFELAQNNYYGNWQLTLPGHLIANSEEAKKRAIKHGIKPHRIDFLPNAVDEPLEKLTQKLSGDRISILFAGRLSKEKRPDLFVRLAIRLKQDMPHLALRFVIAGDGPKREELEATVQRAGLSGSFSFLGQQTVMSDVYKRTDILVLTSEHEGTPNVVLEAMAHGIPVVATDVGGIHKILDADRGFLVDLSDFDGLRLAVETLIKDARLRERLGHNGQNFVEVNHSLRYLGEHLTGIYSKLLGGPQTNG